MILVAKFFIICHMHKPELEPTVSFTFVWDFFFINSDDAWINSVDA